MLMCRAQKNFSFFISFGNCKAICSDWNVDLEYRASRFNLCDHDAYIYLFCLALFCVCVKWNLSANLFHCSLYVDLKTSSVVVLFKVIALFYQRNETKSTKIKTHVSIVHLKPNRNLEKESRDEKQFRTPTRNKEKKWRETEQMRKFVTKKKKKRSTITPSWMLNGNIFHMKLHIARGHVCLVWKKMEWIHFSECEWQKSTQFGCYRKW